MKKYIAICLFLQFIITTAHSQELWERINNPYPGAIYSILKVDGTTIYAAGNGIYKSTDSGESWQHTDYFGDRKIDKLLMDSSGNFYALSDSIFFRSGNGMNDWQKISEFEGQTLKEIYILKNGNIFIITNKNYYLSTDSGKSWELTNWNSNKFVKKALESDEIYALGSLNVIIKSKDFGKTWEECGYFDCNNVYNFFPIDSTSFYLYYYYYLSVFQYDSSSNTFTEKRINFFYDVNAPYTFEQLENGTILLGTWNKTGEIHNESNGIWILYNKDSISGQMLNFSNCDYNINNIKSLGNGNILAATDYGIYKSTDYGYIWKECNTGIASFVDVNQIKFFDENEIYLATFDQFLNRSYDNGKTWTKHEVGYDNFSIHSFEIDKKGNIYAGMGQNSVWGSTDKGEIWKFLTDTLNFGCVPSIGIDSNGVVYAISLKGIYSSSDNGKTWKKSLSDYSSGWWHTFFVSDSNYLYARLDFGIGYSADKGDTWERIVVNSDTNIYPRYFRIGSDGIISAYASEGYYDTEYLYQSFDRGLTWNNITKDFSPDSYHRFYSYPNGDLLLPTKDLFNNSGDNQHQQKLYFYKTKEKMWCDITYKLKDLNIREIVINQKGNIILGNYKGFIYRSTFNPNDLRLMAIEALGKYDSYSLKFYDSLYFDIFLKDLNGKSLENAKVQITDNIRNETVSKISDNNGIIHCSAALTPNFKERKITFDIKASHPGYDTNTYYRYALNPGFILFYESNGEFKWQDTLELKIHLRDIDALDISYADIMIYNPINNIFIKLLCDSAGDLVYKYALPEGIGTKEYDFKIYAQKNRYAFAGVNQTVKITDNTYIAENRNKVHFTIFPNPASDKIKINCCLEKADYIQISLTDIFGNSIIILDNKYLLPGDYLEEYDISALTQGVYLCIMKCGDSIYSGKVILLK